MVPPSPVYSPRRKRVSCSSHGSRLKSAGRTPPLRHSSPCTASGHHSGGRSADAQARLRSLWQDRPLSGHLLAEEPRQGAAVAQGQEGPRSIRAASGQPSTPAAVQQHAPCNQRDPDPSVSLPRRPIYLLCSPLCACPHAHLQLRVYHHQARASSAMQQLWKHLPRHCGLLPAICIGLVPFVSGQRHLPATFASHGPGCHQPGGTAQLQAVPARHLPCAQGPRGRICAAGQRGKRPTRQA